MTDAESSVAVREGGVSNGKQYYVVSATDETGGHASAALTAEELALFIMECQEALHNRQRDAATDTDGEDQ